MKTRPGRMFQTPWKEFQNKKERGERSESNVKNAEEETNANS